MEYIYQQDMKRMNEEACLLTRKDKDIIAVVEKIDSDAFNYDFLNSAW